MGRGGGLHRLMVQRRGRLGRLRRPGRLRAFEPALLRLLHHHVGPALVRWMVQQAANVMHKKWIEQVGDLLLVGELESPLKRDPEREESA